jgi:hypothetical protein
VSNQELTLNFTFTVAQINTIIAGLDELPHKFSRPMIDEIQKQVQAQQTKDVPPPKE